ncbi:hypothetical protein AZE42_03037 [Rhizopogon vesiculosus]|uniref:Uncharacterized protein n=1 Tax=Rhizopogon vesiculosus TaxID=180088 RepID=A0A1J8QBC3_9AGAM|nr:hypothetical protein AZE42_03037 [Rhizopogon vesiculosus]
MSNSPDEPTVQIFAEGAWLQGAMITAILYGVVIVLSIMCWRTLWPRIQRSRDIGYRKNLFFFCYVTSLFMIGTVYVVFNSQMTQLGFINNRFYPGGPSAYEEATSSAPINTAFVLSSWCADLLMIWRCVVVYRDTRGHFIVIILGCVMFVATVVTGTLWLVIVSRPEQATSGWMSFSFLFPYLSVDLAINIFISLLTVMRLLFHRRRISTVLSPAHGVIYASFAAIIVESASIYSICSLLYLIPYALNSTIAYAFMQILGEAQIIAPLLIIYRVAEGKGWTTHSAPVNSATSDTIRMRRMTYPHSSSTSTHPTPLNVEISFHTETTRDDSIKMPKSPYPEYITDHSTDKAGTDIPVATIV